jgi:hypothetical protein
MPETLVAHFIPKYAGPYRITNKPHPDVYMLLLLTTFVMHPVFHVFKLKSFKADDKRSKRKHEYHKGFNLMEHRIAIEIEYKQTRRCGK